MILAKNYPNLNVRKAQKRALNSIYDYCIFDVDMPLKMSRKNMHQYSLHEEHKEIGVLLSNTSTLDKDSNFVLFKDKKALAQSFQHQIILKMKQPDELNYYNWIKMMQSYVLNVNPSFVMIPLNKKSNTDTVAGCNLVIQEINSILFGYAFDTDVVIYQEKESLSSLSYIIQHVAFPSKTSLCLDIDVMESSLYTLKDICDDILRFNISNKISMIHTSKYLSKSTAFQEFLKYVPEDVIVFGKKI